MPDPRVLHEQAERDKVKSLTLTAMACLGWCALGIFCLGWSMHTTDMMLGRAAFCAGVGIGNGGILFTLLHAYRKGERRGDW